MSTSLEQIPALQPLPPLSNGRLSPRSPKRARPVLPRIVKVLCGLALLAGLGWAAWHWLRPDSAGLQEITAVVQRATLPIIVTERGELESSKTVDVRCEVEGYENKIVSILPEGTPVKKGDVVVVFDSDKHKKSYADQEVKVKQAEGKAKAAKGDLEVAKNKAETDTAKAELDLKLAILDRDKYLKGEYNVLLAETKGALALASKELKEAEEKLQHFGNLYRKGFIALEVLRAKEMEVDQRRFAVERDTNKLMVLEKFTKERQEAELTAKAIEAERALARAKSSGAASIAKAQSDLEAAEVTARLEKTTLASIQKQLNNCTVRAPQGGILVYSRDRWWDDASRIQAGSMIHFRQGLFTLPDLTRMQMKVKIHEAMVKKLKKGLKAEIRLDAYSERVLHGTVESVATLASTEGWFDRFVKEYDTIVKIEDLPVEAGLKPGMTGEVRILINQLDDVLVVPVQAVAQKGKQHVCFAISGASLSERPIEVGENNDKFVEVKAGLSENERVALNARARVATEAKQNEVTPETFGAEAKKRAEPRQPPGAGASPAPARMK